MNYVDKKIALKYLANSEILFNKVKQSFLYSYQNGVEEINHFCNTNNVEELYRYIHSIKGISLNIGSMILYEDSEAVLDKIKKEGKIPSLEQFIFTLRNVCHELSNL